MMIHIYDLASRAQSGINQIRAKFSLIGSRPGGADTVAPGANAENNDSEPSTPIIDTQTSPDVARQKTPGDPADALADSFGQMVVQDPSDDNKQRAVRKELDPSTKPNTYEKDQGKPNASGRESGGDLAIGGSVPRGSDDDSTKLTSDGGTSTRKVEAQPFRFHINWNALRNGGRARTSTTSSASTKDKVRPQMASAPMNKLDKNEGGDEEGRAKGGEDQYHFFGSGTLYSIDDGWNVTSQHGTLVHDGLDDMNPDDHTAPFYIGGASYMFGTDGLWMVGKEGSHLPVQLWSGPLDSLDTPTVGMKRKRDDQTTVYNGLVKVGDGNYRETKSIPEQNKHFFCASDRLYYFDDRRRLYTHDGKLVYDGSSSTQTNGTMIPSFQIDGTPYWFEVDGLTTRDANGRRDRVYTWSSKGGPVGQHPSPGQGAMHRNPPASPRPNPGPPYRASESVSATMPSPSGSCSAPGSKDDCYLPSVNPAPLTNTLLGKPDITSSPTPSTSQSPGSSSITSGHVESTGPPLFLASEPRNAASQPTALSQPTVIKTPGTPSGAQPVKKRGGKENKTCTECGKEFRRPIALWEHMNTHTGAKPFVCPFDRCNTGFATKSNMRRHFETHKVGKVDDYEPGVSHQPGETKRQRVEEPEPSSVVSAFVTNLEAQTPWEGRLGVIEQETAKAPPVSDSSNSNPDMSFLLINSAYNFGVTEDNEPGTTHDLGQTKRQALGVPTASDISEAPQIGDFLASCDSGHGGTGLLAWRALITSSDETEACSVEHIRTRTGEQARECPLDQIKSGFATESNTRRHPETREVDQLADSESGVHNQLSATKQQITELYTLPDNQDSPKTEQFCLSDDSGYDDIDPYSYLLSAFPSTLSPASS